MTEPCNDCARLEANGAKRGYYLHEFFLGAPEKERAYGPFCRKRCARFAARRGALRSRVYTRPFYKASEARMFAPHARPVSEAFACSS